MSPHPSPLIFQYFEPRVPLTNKGRVIEISWLGWESYHAGHVVVLEEQEVELIQESPTVYRYQPLTLAK